MRTVLARMIAGAALLPAVSVFVAGRAEAQAIVRYSGTSVADEIDVDDDGRTGYTVSFEQRGPFGNARVQAHVEFAPWDGVSFCDPSSILLRYTFWSGAATYANGDQVYLELADGANCFNFMTGSASDEINLNITGGTGRFEEATGSITARGSSQALLSDPVRDRTAISAFSGESVQHIVFRD